MNLVPQNVLEPETHDDAVSLLSVIRDLSYQREVPGIMEVVKKAARSLLGADGITFVLRDEDRVYYADEDAISPLWKGQRFPASACISGWAIIHKQAVAIEDIYADQRIPHDAYRSTFVKSLIMVPIRQEDPIGAIGAYWASRHKATLRELELLKTLAGTASVALTNAELFLRAQKAIELRDEFLSIASHELKTPLTALKLQMELIQRGLQNKPGSDPKQWSNGLARTSRQLDRLNHLVDDLLDVSRIQLGKLAFTPERVDLSEMARDVIDRMSHALAEAGCAVNLELSPGVTGVWDKLRMEQVVFNLISNVVKYAANGPVTIATSTSATPHGSTARLVVQDSGPGIARDRHKVIFERFERADAARGTSGLGLGLFIVRTIVEGHGGKIFVESEVGSGARFVVELPQGHQAPQ